MFNYIIHYSFILAAPLEIVRSPTFTVNFLHKVLFKINYTLLKVFLYS
jgi:hypothetical protein